MAGISNILALLWLLIIVLFSVAAFILFFFAVFLRVQKKKCGDTVPALLAGIGVICLIPLGITVCGMAIIVRREALRNEEIMAAIENKIYVREDEWRQGFAYGDKYLVPVNILMEADNIHARADLHKIGALVIEDSDVYYTFYQIDNDSGIALYYVKVSCFAGGEYYSRTFVDQNEYDAILDFYDHSSLSLTALWETAPKDTWLQNNWKKLELDLSSKRDELICLSHDVLDDVSDKKQTSNALRDGYEGMSFMIGSEDKILFLELSVRTNGDEVILYLNKYRVEEEIVEKYKEMLLSLMGDAQAELLERADADNE